jgi:hypothetical protein
VPFQALKERARALRPLSGRRNQSVRRGNKSETIKTFVNARGTLLLFNLKSREQILSEHTQQHPPRKINQPHEFLLHMKGAAAAAAAAAVWRRRVEMLI